MLCSDVTMLCSGVTMLCSDVTMLCSDVTMLCSDVTMFNSGHHITGLDSYTDGHCVPQRFSWSAQPISIYGDTLENKSAYMETQIWRTVGQRQRVFD